MSFLQITHQTRLQSPQLRSQQVTDSDSVYTAWLIANLQVVEETIAKLRLTVLCKMLQVILDCGGDEGQSEGLVSELLQSLTVLSPNETELARMTGENLPRLLVWLG